MKDGSRNYASYTYALLFAGASFHLSLAEKQERGCFFHYLSAMLFAAFSVEAFLNHIGRLRFEHWDDSVKRGANIGSKFRLIASDLKISGSEYGRLDHVIRQLISFRNKVVHADTEISKVSRLDLDFGDLPSAGWERICTIGNARQYVSMAKEFIETVNDRSGLGGWEIYVVGEVLPP